MAPTPDDPLDRPGADSSRQAALEQQLAEALALLRRAEASAAAAGAVIHELAQPLTAAMGHVEIQLLDPTLSESVAARLTRTHAQLERMRGLLARLSRIRRHGPDAGETRP